MPSVTQKTYLERASKEYAAQLRSSHGSYRDCAIGYLTDHGITGEMAGRYNLGLVAAPLPGDERFQGALAIPYLSPKGVTALRFRLFHGDSKIGQHKGQKSRLYNTAAYFEAADTIGLAEGEMDTLAATIHLAVPTMGVPGVKNYKDVWTPLFKDFTQVFVFAQGDQRGREFAEEMADKIGWRARIIRCPDGEDVASLAARSGLDGIREVISTSNQEEVDR